VALHFQGTPRLPAMFAELTDAAFAKNRPEPFRYWKNIRTATFTHRAALDVTFADGLVLRLGIELAGGGRFTINAGLSPDTSLFVRRAGFYIEREQPAVTATFITTLSPKL
jgi:hypothetical protein